MKQRTGRFIIYFIIFFIVNMVVNLLFKQELNLLAAFSVALGVSAGIIFLGPFLFGKLNKT
ncbi:hypothetical protein NCCP2716_28430 [Sporosarcina sp. NCCP-2716]|uniref:hypothetical protein n=1 Tax=Sporosarcina sp. NCCP-2716 TaxID=2943679 RepID=UPI00204157C9|nr:hypothetical protein [Sporosarcina sp. NCCP-2716]GKV70345.1 hypothetical protein NCCP2716_28430 [Sporosarcina sp. NCCP-2716]